MKETAKSFKLGPSTKEATNSIKSLFLLEELTLKPLRSMASISTMEIYTIMEESLKMPWHRPGGSRCQYYIKPFSSPLRFMLEYGKPFQTSLVFSRKTRVLFVEAFTVQPDHGYSPRINDIKYWHSCCQNLKSLHK